MDPLPPAIDSLCRPGGRGIGRRPAAARTVIRAALPRLREITVDGAERVPTSGPVLLAANHIGFLDGIVVQHASPRPVSFLVYDKAFTGVTGLLLRSGGAIPMPQDASVGPALGRAVHRLRGGGAVGIFPEGARGRGRFEAAFAGVAWLAQASGAPVVPVGVLGTRVTGQLAGEWPAKGTPLAVVFGDPLPVSRPGGTRRPVRDAVMADLVPRLVEHVHAAADRHGIALPEDIPPDLLPD